MTRKRNSPRQTRFRAELKKLFKRGVPATKAMKKAWARVPKNPRRLTATKARTILHHGRAKGRTLTPTQRGLFGAVASGARLRDYTNPPPIRLFANNRLLGLIGFRPTKGRKVARNPRIDIRI
jgi:hypothetical protein